MSNRLFSQAKKKHLPRLSRALMHAVCIEGHAERGIGPVGIHGGYVGARKPDAKGTRRLCGCRRQGWRGWPMREDESRKSSVERERKNSRELGKEGEGVRGFI